MKGLISNLLREGLIDEAFDGKPLKFECISRDDSNFLIYEFVVPHDEGDYTMIVYVSVLGHNDDKIETITKNMIVKDDNESNKNIEAPTYEHGAYLEVSFKSKEHGYDDLNKGRDIFKIINTVKGTVKDAITKVRKRGLALAMIFSQPLNNSSKVDSSTGQIKPSFKNTRKKIYDYLYNDLVKTGVFKKFDSSLYSGVYSIVRPRKPRTVKKKEPVITNNTSSSNSSAEVDAHFDERTRLNRIVRPPVPPRVQTDNEIIQRINKRLEADNIFIHGVIRHDGAEPFEYGGYKFVYVSSLEFMDIDGQNQLIMNGDYYAYDQETADFINAHKDELYNYQNN